MKYIALSSLLFFLNSGISFSQDKKEFKKDFIEAEYFFLREDYHEAAFLYNELLNQYPLNANLQFLTGASFLSIPGQKERAISFLERAVSSISPGYREGSYREENAPKESLFALAKAYHISNRFDEALEYYEKYKNVMRLSEVAEIEFVHKQMESVAIARELIKDTMDFRFRELDPLVNSGPSNFHAVYAEKDSTMVYMVRKPFYSAIMMARMIDGIWQDPRVINPELMADDNCNVCSISEDGKELYVVKKEEFDKNIYVSYYEDGQWSPLIPLGEKINSMYDESHAAISSDKQSLYFTSDRPGGEGAMDIYLSRRLQDGRWDDPVNLGKPVNTIYSEETPFITSGGKVLFFSSMGHPVMGGYDIFYSKLLPDGNWSQPSNLGFPICSTDDDLFYYPLGEGKQGLITSYQKMLPEGRILLVDMNTEQEEWKYEFRGNIRLADNKSGEEPAEINIKDKNTGKIVTTTKPSGEDGTYSMELDAGEYKMEIKAENYAPEEKDISIIPEIRQKTVVINTELQPEKVAEGEFLVMKNILFGFDNDKVDKEAAFELEKLYQIMSRYPDIYVQVRGHADAIGPASYNLQLSRRRARSVVNFLVEKGISKERFISGAVGESRSIARNVNPDGSDNPEGRKLNRQVEISLINNHYENINVQEIFVPEHLKPVRNQEYVILLKSSKQKDNGIPAKFMDKQIRMLETDNNVFYYCGNFFKKEDAVSCLNEAVDSGYNNAQILSIDKLQNIIDSEEIPENAAEPPFTIQLLALKNPAGFKIFENPQEIQLFESSDGYHRYVTGVFESYDHAKSELKKYITEGFTDAFVMELARYTTVNKQNEAAAQDTGYYFTIQFTATLNPPDPSKIKEFPNFRIVKGKDGYYRCSSGIFIHKTEAEKALIRIRENGYPDAFINLIKIN